MTGALLRRDRFLHQETKGSARRKRKYQRCVAMVRSIRAKATRAFRAKSTCAFILLSSARRFSLTSGTLLVLTGQKLELQKLHEQLATLVRLYVISMKHLCARVSAASLPPSPLTLSLPSFFRCADGFSPPSFDVLMALTIVSPLFLFVPSPLVGPRDETGCTPRRRLLRPWGRSWIISDGERGGGEEEEHNDEVY